MNRKAPLFALAILLAAGPLTLFGCLDDFSVGTAAGDGGGAGGDATVTSEGGPGADGSTDAGTDGADAADLTCVGPTGKFLASAAFPFNGTNHSLVGTSNGGYVFVGDFRGNVTYGDAGIIMGNTTTMDAAAVRFNPDGSLMWQAHFGGTGSDTFQGVTVDGKDDVYVTGYFSSNTFTIGATSFNNPTGANFGIVAKLDGATGAALWAHSFLPGYFGYGCSAIDFDSGRLVVSCSMGTTQSYEPGAGMTAVLQGTQAAGSAVYGLDPVTGYVLWGKGLGAVTSDMSTSTYVSSVDVTANGVVVAGVFSGGALTEKQTNAITVAQVGTKQNGFVTELSASNPALPLWAKGFGDSSSVGQVNSVSAAGTSLTGIVVGGSFSGTVDFGAAPHASVGSSDTFVMMLRNKAGAPAWDKYFGGTLDEGINRVRFDNCGRPERR